MINSIRCFFLSQFEIGRERNNRDERSESSSPNASPFPFRQSVLQRYFRPDVADSEAPGNDSGNSGTWSTDTIVQDFITKFFYNCQRIFAPSE